MANPHRGEVELIAGDKSFKLVFTINAVCELEDALKKGVNEIVADMSHIRTIRGVLWAGLLRHHKMTLEEAGDVMNEAGAAATAAAINRAMALAFPQPEKASENPR